MYEGYEELEVRPMMGEVNWTDEHVQNKKRTIQIGGYIAHIVDDGECNPVINKSDECERILVCNVCGKRFCIGG